MEEINKFNVRVYALIIENEQLLILKEPYAGEILHKFPGGGIEFGEGLIEGLHRELKEELNLEVKSYSHFYTQEHFLRSKFHSDEQLFTVYYLVQVQNIASMHKIDTAIESIHWVSLRELMESHVNLPVDQLVVKTLKDQFEKGLLDF